MFNDDSFTQLTLLKISLNIIINSKGSDLDAGASRWIKQWIPIEFGALTLTRVWNPHVEPSLAGASSVVTPTRSFLLSPWLTIGVENVSVVNQQLGVRRNICCFVKLYREKRKSFHLLCDLTIQIGRDINNSTLHRVARKRYLTFGAATSPRTEPTIGVAPDKISSSATVWLFPLGYQVSSLVRCYHQVLTFFLEGPKCVQLLLFNPLALSSRWAWSFSFTCGWHVVSGRANFAGFSESFERMLK